MNIESFGSTGRHFLAGLASLAVLAAAAPVGASSLENAACAVFGAGESCRTVKVFDARECIVKVHPQPLPDLEPEVAACLRDEVRTRKVHLRKALAGRLTVTDRISVAGDGVVEVLVRYDKHGAAVWESQSADSFALKGDADRARGAVARIASAHCAGASRMVGGGTSGGTIGVKDAFARAADGSILLVDIRLPSEWRSTGVGVGAHAITMHQGIDRFVDRLRKAGGDQRPIALMCAEGVRSAAMQQTLKQYGFKGILNVHEGMRGGTNGPGWIKSGLPVRQLDTAPAQAKLTQ